MWHDSTMPCGENNTKSLSKLMVGGIGIEVWMVSMRIRKTLDIPLNYNPQEYLWNWSKTRRCHSLKVWCRLITLLPSLASLLHSHQYSSSK
ncbi:hypothetical protein E1A91_D01G184700v1 [Gossypium mustelinum]|uniref:Uncharacterized protein n=1 Tax=Gossypium mustelinum TaxID=34275 RepID=A0A5D2W885_GOSMU|nr:hypothetical protein E1A91_D01G184700v1 [Gossypium mustelinum]